MPRDLWCSEGGGVSHERVTPVRVAAEVHESCPRSLLDLLQLASWKLHAQGYLAGKKTPTPLQGYLAHKKQPPLRTLQWDYA
jgi:hypothetical protein